MMAWVSVKAKQISRKCVKEIEVFQKGLLFRVRMKQKEKVRNVVTMNVKE